MVPPRIVYRGNLALPDSHIILDGIVFAAFQTAQYTIMNNPLALSLETLRGISLRFLALVPLKDIYYDAKAMPRIAMDIHPDALLSQIYFGNIFCLDADKAFSVGVRVALGDTDATNIVIYASMTEGCEIQLLAARIIPRPTVVPRPDDPTPRRPPPVLSAKGRDLFAPLPMGPPAVPKKARALTEPAPTLVGPSPVPDLERRNKDIVKAIVSRTIPAQLLPKTHVEYKDTLNWIYRGVCYALRGDIKLKPVDEDNALRLARVHIGMYVKGS